MNPKSAGAFAGVKLTEQTDAGNPSIEQRLFSISPLSPSNLPIHQDNLQQVSNERSQEVGKEGNKDSSKQASLPEKKEIGQYFDLNDMPHRKDSFLYTESEFNALEDLKLALR